MAFRHASLPLELAITIFFGPCATAIGPAAAAAPSAAELFIHIRLLMLNAISKPLLPSSATLTLYSMREQIRPAASISGAIQLPGDKSISHRYAMLAAIAEGTTKLENYSTGADCQSTLACVRALGAIIDKRDGATSIQGRGLGGLREPADTLDAGNSG